MFVGIETFSRKQNGSLIDRSYRYGFAILVFCLMYGTGLAEGQTGSGNNELDSANKNSKTPNILFIMVDDLGKEWVSCYGAKGIKTPNIDRLAAGGMKFNNAWCMPQCTPTRVTLLTGQYPFRHGWTNHWDVPRWGNGANFDAKQNTTFANVMKKAGYATCAAGKWQIDDFRVEPNAMKEAGFDQWCMWTGYEGGNKKSGKRYWDSYIHQSGAGSKTYSGKFGPDLYAQFLIDFIKKNKQKPMLLYYPMALTHGPIVSTPSNQEKNLKKTEKFAGMVRYTDKLVGKLIETLKEEGLEKNTIVIFTTDNGTSSGISNLRLGHKVKGGKAKMSEQNGTAQPFIAYCPGRISAGKTTDQLIDFTDILPTFAELGGAPLPAGRVVDGKSFAPLILGKTDKGPREWILSMGGKPAAFRNGRVVPKQKYDDRVIRDLRFKLWVGTDRKPTALYDLKNDPWEENNLIESTKAEVLKAKEKLISIEKTFPSKDASPIYKENPAQPWDLRNKKRKKKARGKRKEKEA